MISQKINNTDGLKKILIKLILKKITDRINLKEISDRIDLKNDEKSEPSYKTDYEYYIKNPNILADKIVEIYDNNPNAKVLNPANKDNSIKLQNVVNNIDRDVTIAEQYKEFVREFTKIAGNTKILYDYQTYKNLVLDRINNEEVSTSIDDSIIKKVGKEFIKNLTGQGINEYKMIKIDKDALKRIFLKLDIIMDKN